MTTEIKQRIKQLQEKKKNLKWHHPGDDDPTGEFYTVREQRRSLSDKINRLKNI